MNQSFIVSAVMFIIIMVIFHIIKDIFLTTNLTPQLRQKLNKRWLVSTAIGLLLLYFMYGRHGP
jgi:hypothetical protein